jgi:hypothetical protein
VRTRYGVARRSAAATALALFVVAQPQMLCALHCMVFDHMADMEAGAVAQMPIPAATPAEGASPALAAHGHHPVAMPCGHGMNVITAPSVPGTAVGLATVASVGLPVFGIRPTVSVPSGTEAVIVAYTPRVDTPPPRA